MHIGKFRQINEKVIFTMREHGNPVIYIILIIALFGALHFLLSNQVKAGRAYIKNGRPRWLALIINLVPLPLLVPKFGSINEAARG